MRPLFISNGRLVWRWIAVFAEVCVLFARWLAIAAFSFLGGVVIAGAIIALSVLFGRGW